MKLILDTEAKTLTMDDAGQSKVLDLYSQGRYNAIIAAIHKAE